MDKRITKLYAAYRSGCFGSKSDNIFEVYYSFLANIILEENLIELNEETLATIAQKFENKYGVPLQSGLVRQILGVGVKREEIVYVDGAFIVHKEKFKQYSINTKSFDSCWKHMIVSFNSYCTENAYNLSSVDVEDCILKFLDAYDAEVVLGDERNAPSKADAFHFPWYWFLKQLPEKDYELFDFIVSISFSNILKEAVFYSSDTNQGGDTYEGLNVYLDTPIIFSLLGMDSQVRIESSRMLISAIKKVGCSVYVFDQNFDEVTGIMENAKVWATSSAYDIRKANNVARFFRDNLEDASHIADFCVSVEAKLNELGVTKKTTTYDFTQNEFQEDENKLSAMIEARYSENGRAVPPEKKQSIEVDVRSIIMTYHERRERTSTLIQSSGHIFITSNNAIANVSKDYELDRSPHKRYIPACVSADLFGSILWLFTPVEKMEYQRRQLLADCYTALQPSLEMMDKFVDSLERAYAAGDIDEKRFLFLRSHGAVNEALMSVTRGDYAQIHDSTPQEVYREIVAIADKKHADESSAHSETKAQLEVITEEKNHLDNELSKIRVELEKRDKDTSEKIRNLQSELNRRDKDAFDAKCTRWGWVVTIVCVVLPYLILLTAFQIFRGAYHQLEISPFLWAGLLALATFIARAVYAKGKKYCFSKVRKYFESKNCPYVSS